MLFRSQGTPREALDFVHANADWFNMDTADNASMRAYAISTEGQMHKNFPQMPLSQRFEKVKEMVVKKFPTYFGVTPSVAMHRPTRPRVEGGSAQQVTKKKKITINDMPIDARKMAKNMWHASNKKIDLDEYARLLVETGAVTL